MLWGTQKNRLNKRVLLSTQNICLDCWVRKLLHFYAQKLCLTGPMILSSDDFAFSNSHFAAVFDYLKHNPLEPVDRQKLEEECGIGVVVTPDQVEAAVSHV